MHESDTRCEGTAVQEAADVKSIEETKSDLEWKVRFNIAVNEDAERYYGFWDTVFKVVVALFGTYAFATIFIDKNVVYSVCALFVTAISLFTLVDDLKDKQIKARSQRNRYCSALTSVIQAKDQSDVNAAMALIDKIEMDDISSTDICDALAANVAIDQMGLDSTYRVEIGWFKWITRYILPWKRPKYRNR